MFFSFEEVIFYLYFQNESILQFEENLHLFAFSSGGFLNKKFCSKILCTKRYATLFQLGSKVLQERWGRKEGYHS
jgi:hypothetical protein